MKHVSKLLWFSLCLFSLWLLGCQKEARSTDENKLSLSNLNAPSITASIGSLTDNTVTKCAAQTFSLCTGGNANSASIGNLKVESGSDGKVYLTFTTTGTNYITGIKLYAGDGTNIPVNNGGNAVVGQFPFKYTVASSNTYSVVLSDLTGTITLAAHVETAATAAWADGCTGTRINTGNGNWATKLTYTVQPCTVSVPLCSMSQGYWFANGGHTWPSGSVVVGGKTYTQAEGAAIWNTYSKNLILGFTQVAALKLSGTAYNSDAQLNQAVTTIETWLTSQSKLTATAVPEMPTNVSAAAGFIGDWINTHHCN
ncbi:hypothetical protein [Flavisolibacter tropicus]|uniref:Lipoprotein n=1 Tax=Flavisolibacter tropicus TaxID=1492898 RepID=A0A172TX06_9BACT|nr:hypothetical protein [Flavisolibacter tropicus]ANE51498.1 hypothetical protein SY85_14280 [Flavisolibacter tropicus]